jgi:hypothetical protein
MRVNLDAAVGLWAVKVLQRWLQSMCDEQFCIDCDLEHVGAVLYVYGHSLGWWG